jgi:hypothetical protein
MFYEHEVHVSANYPLSFAVLCAPDGNAIFWFSGTQQIMTLAIAVSSTSMEHVTAHRLKNIPIVTATNITNSKATVYIITISPI